MAPRGSRVYEVMEFRHGGQVRSGGVGCSGEMECWNSGVVEYGLTDWRIANGRICELGICGLVDWEFADWWIAG